MRPKLLLRAGHEQHSTNTHRDSYGHFFCVTQLAFNLFESYINFSNKVDFVQVPLCMTAVFEMQPLEEGAQRSF